MLSITDYPSNTALSLSQRHDTPQPIKVLVVEDDKIQWPLWAHILKTTFYDVEIEYETTEAGAEAVLRRAYQNDRIYNLVVSDIFLDGGNSGIDLWNRYGQVAMNFIFVSGLTKNNFKALLNAGSTVASGGPLYLQKPVSAGTGREVLRALSIHR